ncbi:hypothetical protein EBL85_04930 [Marichromatium sp. AB32]|nr:hypothetical protein EBL85_04930 [Marichromatium sp. AB32]
MASWPNRYHRISVAEVVEPDLDIGLVAQLTQPQQSVHSELGALLALERDQAKVEEDLAAVRSQRASTELQIDQA